MANNVITSQTGGREFNRPDITKYSLFVGGVNATHHALENYSPMLNNYGRLFMVRPPEVIQYMFAGGDDSKVNSSENLFNQFKHMLEYMNRSVSGFAEKTLTAAGNPIQGGYAGRSFQTPSVTQDTTNTITIGMYEMTGAPILTVVDAWMNAIGDENSGFATYGGYISGGYDGSKEVPLYKRNGQSGDRAFAYNEAAHTAECIYVVTDKSGAQVERAVLIADMFPLSINQGAVLNMDNPGSHDNVTYDISFNAVLYRSPIITAIANDLLKQYLIVSNSLNFNPQLGDAVYGGSGTYGINTDHLGELPTDSAVGTSVGNIPVFTANTAPKQTINVNQVDVNSTQVNRITPNSPAVSGLAYKQADGKFTT